MDTFFFSHKGKWWVDTSMYMESRISRWEVGREEEVGGVGGSVSAIMSDPIHSGKNCSQLNNERPKMFAASLKNKPIHGCKHIAYIYSLKYIFL